MKMRIEKDSLGVVEVPLHAFWGPQTQRALLNFPISGWVMPEAFIKALGLVKAAAARANATLKALSLEEARAIETIAMEIAQGFHLEHFPIDVFQTGSATSSNMNINEVIHYLAKTRLQKDLHPNDHINMSQSSNDIIPTVIHVALVLSVKQELLPALEQIDRVLTQRMRDLKNIVKTGRTHLMDAVPMTFAQELSGWKAQIDFAKNQIRHVLEHNYQLPVGGTAIGTGLNADPCFAQVFVEHLREMTSEPFQKADNCFELISAQDRVVQFSGTLKTLATAVMKISNDLRWMNSGPIAGLGEIVLPSLQPGSSIMPGKVNPVVPESAAMVCAHVIGTDMTVTIAGQSGQFQLNVMLPLIAYHVLENVRLMANTLSNLSQKALNGFIVNEQHVSSLLKKNPILITALNKKIGYEKGAEIVKKSLAQGRSVYEVALEETSLSAQELESLLDPAQLTQGGVCHLK
jgi:fumarate hydratase class II